MSLNAYVLGIDPGAEGGGALLAPGGGLVRSAQIQARDATSRTSLLTEAVQRARDEGVDLIIAREKWQAGGPHMTPQMAAGLGAAWGLWREQIHIFAPFLPPNRVHAVYPSTWRRAVLGGGAKKAGGWESLARIYVTGRFRLPHDPGPDEVVAICVGCWALTDQKVRQTVQARPRWHSKVEPGASLPALREELRKSAERIAALEHALAERALAERALRDTGRGLG